MFIFTDINLIAAFVAAIFSFAFGVVWYTALFGKVWQKEVGLTEKQLNDTNYAKTYGGSFVCIFVMMLFMSALLNNLEILGSNMWMEALQTGLFTGVMVASASVAINYLYQFKSLKLFLIDAGYQTLFITLGAAILAFFG